MKKAPVDKIRETRFGDVEPVSLLKLRDWGRSAWPRLSDHGDVKDLARDVDIDQALHLSEATAAAVQEPTLLRTDLMCEHIFVNLDTGCLTGVIDWSDACIGHPSIDIHGPGDKRRRSRRGSHRPECWLPYYCCRVRSVYCALRLHYWLGRDFARGQRLSGTGAAAATKIAGATVRCRRETQEEIDTGH